MLAKQILLKETRHHRQRLYVKAGVTWNWVMDAWGQVKMASGTKSVRAVNLQHCDIITEGRKVIRLNRSLWANKSGHNRLARFSGLEPSCTVIGCLEILPSKAFSTVRLDLVKYFLLHNHLEV